ncbi:GntR family transcriptional regulator [Candidatus Saccharibacteria bacterium]|nr:GntR family transcriptional regulator [Candidatus Saccharibacteria bacterium]
MNNFDNNSPVYLQIAERIATQIFGGKLAPGVQLPSVREIALAEKANPNTVQKALAELELEGLIINKRTIGKFVTDDRELISEKREDYAENLTHNYENKMSEIGAEVRMPKILWLNDEAAELLDKVEQMEEEKRSKRWFF